MSDLAIGYDHINKRLVAELDGERYAILVTVTGTKHAAISAHDVESKTGGRIPVAEFVKVLKRYRNKNGKSFIVEVV